MESLMLSIFVFYSLIKEIMFFIINSHFKNIMPVDEK